MKISGTEHEKHADGFEISSVGAWLKAAREGSGVTLDEVAKVTRIGKNYLEAIEEGDLSKLPSPAYTRGFIRLYAAHLGLPPENATAMMAVDPASSVETHPEKSADPEPIRRLSPAYRRSLVLIVALTFAMAAGYLLLKQTGQPGTPVHSSRIETLPADQALKTVPSQQQQSAPPISEPSSSPHPQQLPGVHQGLVLRLKAVSDGKVHITIDDSVSQEYDLVSGDLVEWKAENAFMLDLDNAASVEGELNGVKLDPFGEPGSAAHLRLEADGVHTSK